MIVRRWTVVQRVVGWRSGGLADAARGDLAGGAGAGQHDAPTAGGRQSARWRAWYLKKVGWKPSMWIVHGMLAASPSGT